MTWGNNYDEKEALAVRVSGPLARDSMLRAADESARNLERKEALRTRLIEEFGFFDSIKKAIGLGGKKSKGSGSSGGGGSGDGGGNPYHDASSGRFTGPGAGGGGGSGADVPEVRLPMQKISDVKGPFQQELDDVAKVITRTGGSSAPESDLGQQRSALIQQKAALAEQLRSGTGDLGPIGIRDAMTAIDKQIDAIDAQTDPGRNDRYNQNLTDAQTPTGGSGQYVGSTEIPGTCSGGICLSCDDLQAGIAHYRDKIKDSSSGIVQSDSDAAKASGKLDEYKGLAEQHCRDYRKF